MRLLKYGNIELKIYTGYEITKSSQEIVYSDCECDFTGHTAEDLPEKYQEVNIIDKNDFGDESVVAFGYVDTFDFGEMRETDVDTTIRISLLSPMKLTTLRTTTAIGTYQLKDLIQNYILIPLINDGYTIEELNIIDRQTSVNYLVETIETCMNNLSNKYNFWWYIDENKGIFIKDIDTMINQEPSKIYDNKHRIKGLQYINPTTISEGYANVINFKNVRLYQNSIYSANSMINPLISQPIDIMKKESQIDFNNAVDINKNNIIKSGKANDPDSSYYKGIYFEGTYSDGTNFSEYIMVNSLTGEYLKSSNIGFDGNAGDEEKAFLLIKDSFFNNLVVGFKYNNSNKNIISIDYITSNAALIDCTVKFYNDKEILSKKGLISNTGIVEKTMDMNESWKTPNELKELGKSQSDKNSLNINGEIELCTDANVINVGDVLKIDKIIINGKYIVTQTKEHFSNGESQYYITAKNSNIVDNYIDVFRGEQGQQKEEKGYYINVLHYDEDGFNEIHEVVQ